MVTVWLAPTTTCMLWTAEQRPVHVLDNLLMIWGMYQCKFKWQVRRVSSRHDKNQVCSRCANEAMKPTTKCICPLLLSFLLSWIYCHSLPLVPPPPPPPTHPLPCTTAEITKCTSPITSKLLFSYFAVHMTTSENEAPHYQDTLVCLKQLHRYLE